MADRKYSATQDPTGETNKWRGWVADPRPNGQGNRLTHDGNGFIHPTKAAAVKAIKAQHPPEKASKPKPK